MRLTNHRGVDVAIEALGKQEAFESCLRILKPEGTLSSLGVYSKGLTVPLDAFDAGLGDHKIVTTLCPGGKERMRRLLNIVASKRVDFGSMVTHRFKLSQILDAYQLFAEKRDGVLKVAITPSQEIDVFWGSCSLPNQHGFVSLGPNNCYEYETLRRAKTVILELNPNIPFAFGMTCIPESRVDAFIYSENVLPTYDREARDPTDHKIAALVAELVPDEATLQFGIGSIPNALTQALRGKKNLGIHTEMINDSILELFEAGVITGGSKTIWPEKIIGSFAYGSQKLYHFIDHNPMVELYPASMVNDPLRIGRNHKMISTDSVFELDITGQVCSESLGHQELSGVGGATGTHIGAQHSNGGRGIIALRSATRKGQGKIVSELNLGAKISVSCNDVDTIVTEHGVARLKRKTVADRALSLIGIDHPNNREDLLFDTKKFGYI